MRLTTGTEDQHQIAVDQSSFFRTARGGAITPAFLDIGLP
jgi:hypothetical protein